ncbi:FAD-dependent 5-carboxymethylaminomethyl-2-thiouridine(34) oxidoreductase MnmC [Macromonas nakdongensis]|uniref:FAD-dependent 5-carboxymethylaminomethyl-2-thiouridine(34) oxidoreductase MnmC n=1 Tax=Macromonas nakdongensis TaxID=1843082 RepID=UPI0012FE910F|nr:FAD-dependent 5-carboxymethylaminomethyl-2-thiouridine(34) oxidoreductase MnmC [Macromonas nakdongensis]
MPWAQQPHGHLLDTAWGDGRSFLQAWHAWRTAPQRPNRLCYTAVVPDPTACVAPDALPEPLRPLAADLNRAWHGLLPGVHRLGFDGDRVQLTLCTGPLKNALAGQDTALDGVLLHPVAPEADAPFPSVLKVLARLCRPGARLWYRPQTATEACELQVQGFHADAPSPESASGGHTFTPRWTGQRHLRTPQASGPGRVLVVGAGLAGSGVAWALARRGWQVQVIDRGAAPACGASGLPVGLVAPHVSPDDAALSRLSRQGVRSTLARAQQLLRPGLDWAPSGVLEHRGEGKRARPQPADWPAPWGPQWSRDATPTECAAAHLPATARGLWHGTAGWIRPAALVRAQLDHPHIHWQGGTTLGALRRHAGEWQALDAHGQVLGQAPVLVLASAFDTGALLQGLGHLPVHALRGQVTWGALNDLPAAAQGWLPHAPVNGHGSFVHGMPGPDGRPLWLVGSTFERGATDAHTTAADQLANRQRLDTLLPALGAAMAPAFAQAQAWAGVRCTLPDRLPAVGPVDPQGLPGLHVCVGLGARGLTLSVLCGEVLAAQLQGEPWPLERKLAQALMAERFLRPA